MRGRAHRPPDQQPGPRGSLPGRARRLPQARRRRRRQHRRRQPVQRRRRAEAAGADPRRRGRHGRRRPPRRHDRALLRRQEGAAAGRQLGRAQALGHRDRRHDLRLPRLQPRGGAGPARHRQLHLHAGEPDPGRQDAGRRRGGRDRDQPADARVAPLRLDRRLRAPQRALDPAHLRPLRAAAGLRQRQRRRRRPRARRLDAVPDRLDLQRRLERPHPVADPRRGALHRGAAAAGAGRDRRPARRPAGDDPAGLRAGAPGRALARGRALPLRARRARSADGVAAEIPGLRVGALARGRLGHRRVRPPGELPRDRRRPHRRDHLRLLPDRLARPLQARLRADHGALVGGLHHDLDPLPAGRTAALPAHLRTAGQGRTDRPADAGRGDDPARPGRLLRGARAGAARADPGRPAGGQRNPLLGLLRRRPLLRGELLRPRLPRRQRASASSSP